MKKGGQGKPIPLFSFMLSLASRQKKSAIWRFFSVAPRWLVLASACAAFDPSHCSFFRKKGDRKRCMAHTQKLYGGSFFLFRKSTYVGKAAEGALAGTRLCCPFARPTKRDDVTAAHFSLDLSLSSDPFDSQYDPTKQC